MNKTILIGNLKNGIITTERPSGLTDSIPVRTKEEGYVKIYGSIQTHNTTDRHLKIYIAPITIDTTTEESNNLVLLSGYICKSPVYRVTPGGKKITDILLAVNREEEIASDYIPCICWGDNATKAAQLHIGDKITIEGRIQSRQYLKNWETKTAYEISINEIKIND